MCFPARGLSPPYDMIVRGADGEFHKVQVKRAHYRTRGRHRTLRVNITDSGGKPYPRKEVDVMAIVDVDTHRVWFIPMAALKRQKTVSLTSGKWDKWLL